MKAFLMYKDHDFDIKKELPWNEPALTQDLEFNTLFNAMALDDKPLLEVLKKAVLSGSIISLDEIIYRQNILKDCLKTPTVIRDIYALAGEADEGRKKTWWVSPAAARVRYYIARFNFCRSS